MEYRKLGKWGLKVSQLSLGAWLTFGNKLGVKEASELMKAAFDRGVNFFDNAEVYSAGKAEEVMGEAIKQFRREDLVISTKIFWGGSGPNDEGLSYKHLVEGAKRSLKRLQLDYVDMLFCHRPDPETPIEETVRAMDYLTREGLVYYWGTSEWPAERIIEAIDVARRSNAAEPCMEQPQYNLLSRYRFENEYRPLFREYGYGSTIWSPLASGILTGKYNNGLPPGSRLDQTEWLRGRLTPEKIAKVKRLEEVSKEYGLSLPALSIAWCLKNQDVSTVILGASTPAQLEENLAAGEAVERITPDLMKALDGIFPAERPAA